jgi:hypothetical protein
VDPKLKQPCRRSCSCKSFSNQPHCKFLSGRELIVIDDAPEPSAFFADLADPSVRYIRVEKPVQLGEKRNLLSREARGTVIAHFDDDDWCVPFLFRPAALRRRSATVPSPLPKR